MTEDNTPTPEETLKRKAYMEGLKLKNSGLEAEVIYARLEKQGIPEALAKQVVRDLMTERKKEVVTESKINMKVALIRIGIGVAAAIVSALILPDHIIIPIGFIGGGIISAFLAMKKMEE